MKNPVSLPLFYSMWNISFLLDSVYYFILHTIAAVDLLHPSSTPRPKPFKVFLIYFSKCPSFSTIQSCVQNLALKDDKNKSLRNAL